MWAKDEKANMGKKMNLLKYEKELLAKGYQIIAAVDEVGVSCYAGDFAATDN